MKHFLRLSVSSVAWSSTLHHCQHQPHNSFPNDEGQSDVFSEANNVFSLQQPVKITFLEHLKVWGTEDERWKEKLWRKEEKKQKSRVRPKMAAEMKGNTHKGVSWDHNAAYRNTEHLRNHIALVRKWGCYHTTMDKMTIKWKCTKTKLGDTETEKKLGWRKRKSMGANGCRFKILLRDE